MKKFILIFSLFSFLFSLTAAYAYTQTDVSNAQFLADKGIIVKQSTTAGYRLDSTITRAELIGIALKLKGVTLPSYQCKGYFTDVRNNDWICRAVELAADNSLVTRANARFRAQDNITRAEALAIIMSAGSVQNLSSIEKEGYNGFSVYDVKDWQKEVILKAHYRGVINNDFNQTERGGSYGYTYKADTFATRSEVFEFVRNILSFEIIGHAEWSHSDTLYLKKGDVKIEVDNGGVIKNPTLIDNYLIYDWGSTGGTVKKIFNTQTLELIDRVFFGEIDDEQKYVFGCKDMGGSFCSIFSLEKGRTVYTKSLPEESGFLNLKYPGNGKFQIVDEKGKATTVDINKERTSAEKEELRFYVLELYYWRINNGSLQHAYNMRSPTGVTYETFKSWYNNEVSFFISGNIKSVGDNTYEFIVNTMENGEESTYKVKSKVNLENFTINNISSVKQ